MLKKWKLNTSTVSTFLYVKLSGMGAVAHFLEIGPRFAEITALSIVAVTILIILERLYEPAVAAWGEPYPALLTFLVIASKTAIPFLLLWYMAGLNFGCLGWLRGGIMQSLGKGIVLAAVMMACAGIYQKYSYLIFGTPYQSTGGTALQHAQSFSAIVLLLTASLLNAWGEEIIFRGMLLPVLSQHAGIFLALVLQSFIFTLYHFFPLQNSLLLFFMGILFGLGYVWSGSLITPVIAHLIENGAGVAVFLLKHNHLK